MFLLASDPTESRHACLWIHCTAHPEHMAMYKQQHRAPATAAQQNKRLLQKAKSNPSSSTVRTQIIKAALKIDVSFSLAVLSQEDGICTLGTWKADCSHIGKLLQHPKAQPQLYICSLQESWFYYGLSASPAQIW